MFVNHHLKNAVHLLCSFLFLFLDVDSRLLGQNTFAADYKPIKSQSNLPDIFTSTLEAKVADDLKNAEKTKVFQQKKITTLDEFFISSNYVLNEVLRGGNVLYNDTIGIYINTVAAKIMAANHITEKVYFLVIKNTEVNAFTFDKGVVLVTTGLLSRLHNESELAFILCHELVHYLKKHSFNEYIDFLDIDRKRKRYFQSTESRLLESCRYSRANEFESDIEGLKLLAATDYSLAEALHAFDVLKNSDLPFGTASFKKSFFEDSLLVLPDVKDLDSIYRKTVAEDYDDLKSTHPNIKKRKEAVDSVIKTVRDTVAARVVFSANLDAAFLYVQELSRFENCRQLLIERRWNEALYDSWCLLGNYPENRYLHSLVSRCFLAQAKYEYEYELFLSKNGYRKPPLVIDSGLYENYQQTDYFLKQLAGFDAAALALNYFWKNTGTSDQLADQNLGNNILYQLCMANYSARKRRLDYNRTIVSFSPFMDKIFKRLFSNDYDPHYTTAKAPDRLLDDPRFRSAYPKAKDYFMNSYVQHPLPIDSFIPYSCSGFENYKVMILNPFYYKIVQEGRHSNVQYYSSERSIQKLKSFMDSCAGLLKCTAQFIDPRAFGARQVNQYNDFSSLQEWTDERLYNLYPGDKMYFVTNSFDRNIEIASENHCRYVVVSGLVSKYRPKKLKVLAAIGSVIPNLWVVTFPYLFSNSFHAYYHFAVLDLMTGKVTYLDSRDLKIKDTDDVLKSKIYASFYFFKKSIAHD